MSNLRSKTLFNRSGRERGFTLIEIMIVLTLLGLIGTFAVRSYMSSQQKGYRQAAKIMLQQIKTSLDDYYRECNALPTTAEGLEALIHKPASSQCKNYDPNGYMAVKAPPKDPWGNEYVYVCDDGRHITTLKSYAADGKDGGDGFDKDINFDDQ